MTDESTQGTPSEQVQDLEQLLRDFIEALAEARGAEAETETLDLTAPTAVGDADGIESLVGLVQKTDVVIAEIAFTSVMTSLIELREAENQHYYEVSLLIDLAIHMRDLGAVHIDLAHLLFIMIIQSLPVDWTLHFWPYFESRAPKFSKFCGVELQAIRHPGMSTLLALNIKLGQLEGNNEPTRDKLKAKILLFASEVFPGFQPLLSNSKFMQNVSTAKEHYFNARQQTSMYALFWRLQEIFENPFQYLLNNRRISYLNRDTTDVVKHLIDIENRDRSQPKRQAVKDYNRNDLTQEQRTKLQSLCDAKTFKPTFFINQERFQEQIKTDSSLRRTVFVQVYSFASLMISIMDDSIPELKNSRYAYEITRFRKEADLSKLEFLRNIRVMIERVLYDHYPDLLSVLRRINDIDDVAFFRKKLSQFTGFAKVFGKMELDSNVEETLAKMAKPYQKFWAAYGTAAITKHWKVPTGLHLLEKPRGASQRQSLQDRIESYREAIKSDPETKSLNTWRALRAAREVCLVKFSQVNQSVGLEGLFDESLKGAYDKERALIEAGRRTEDERREKEDEERKKKLEQMQQQIEEMRAAAAERKRLARERQMAEEDDDEYERKRRERRDRREEEEKREEERKRKASQDLFDEQSKKAKLESSRRGRHNEEELPY